MLSRAMGSRCWWPIFVAGVFVAGACGSASDDEPSSSGGAAGVASGAGGASAGGGSGGRPGGSGESGVSAGGAASAGGAGGAEATGSGGEAGAIQGVDTPTTCAEAAIARTSLGCEFWPTLVANPVWVEFDPAVVVANPNAMSAEVVVTGPNGFMQEATVPGQGSVTIVLAWVDELKGPEWSREVPLTTGGTLAESTRVNGGAYRLVSSVPVTAWQFNPLDYTKDLPDCSECSAASNGASVLLPTTSLTGSYRVTGYSTPNEGTTWGSDPGGFAITATQDGTDVQIKLAPGCGVEDQTSTEPQPCLAAGSGAPERYAGEVLSFAMDAGDVVQLVGEWSLVWGLWNADVSGSLVFASAPVQVIAFNSKANVPDNSVALTDHVEEIVLPAEALSTRYVVVPPTKPGGGSVGHVVRLYGNVDGTQLSYPEGKPMGAPDAINAGQVVEIPGRSGAVCTSADDHCLVNAPFIVEGDQPFPRTSPTSSFRSTLPSCSTASRSRSLSRPSGRANGGSCGSPSLRMACIPSAPRMSGDYSSRAWASEARRRTTIPLVSTSS